MTNADARFNKYLRPRKPEGSLGRTAQDVHLDSHTAPELSTAPVKLYLDIATCWLRLEKRMVVLQSVLAKTAPHIQNIIC